MPHHKLTDNFVKNVKPPATGQIDYFDPALPGFSLRVTAKGVKAWCIFYRIDGVKNGEPARIFVRQSLGRYPTLLLGKARKKAGAVLELVDAGKDPRLEAERERRESADSRANTVKLVAERFFREIGATDDETAKRKGKTLRTAPEVKRTIERFLLPKFGDRPIGDVSRRELIALFDDIAEVNGPIAANRALSWVRRFFKWSKGKDYIETSPAADIEKPGEERKGDRTLNDGELREVWAAAETLGHPYGHFVKALLLTGRRRTAVATMRRSEIDREARTWKPTDGTDNKQQPELPLFTAMEALLDSVPAPTEADKDADHIFRSGIADTAINSFTAVKEQIDAAIAAARAKAGIKKAMPAWDLQRDIRRTVKTRLADLRVPKEIRDLIMGHARQGMDAVYDHSERREEKREALERWGLHLAEILQPRPANVVKLHA
jgi:integrase